MVGDSLGVRETALGGSPAVAAVRNAGSALLWRQGRAVAIRPFEQTVSLSCVLPVGASPLSAAQSLTTETNVCLTVHECPVASSVCDDPFICCLVGVGALPRSFLVAGYALSLPP